MLCYSISCTHRSYNTTNRLNIGHTSHSICAQSVYHCPHFCLLNITNCGLLGTQLCVIHLISIKKSMFGQSAIIQAVIIDHCSDAQNVQLLLIVRRDARKSIGTNIERRVLVSIYISLLDGFRAIFYLSLLIYYDLYMILSCMIVVDHVKPF